jgi:aspartyl-tRNA synthetase
MRSHYCGELNTSLLDQEVKLYGWVHRSRNLGGLIFIDLRDREGIVQVIAHPENQLTFSLAEKLHNEDVICVKGCIRMRPENMLNKDMKTGEIEVDCRHLEIINQAEPLPLQIAEQQNVADEQRLKYRYLDLRRPEVAKRLIFRAKVAQTLRQFLDRLGFIEIETPILTKSTPEGARDYLVPSRNFPGEFYALPQSPQLFKQLLMVGGMDRYYQIARCFRDEDLRADRQPEFTQLDIETSFLNERELQHIMEEMMRELFNRLLNITLPNPFPCLTFDEAMNRYGSDKPDLRIPLEIIDIGDLVTATEFKVFAEAANNTDSRVAALRLPKGAKLSNKELDDYTNLVKTHGAKGLANLKVYDLNANIDGLKSTILKFIEPKTITAILARVGAENEDTIFFVADKIDIVNNSLGALRLKLAKDHNLIEAGWRPLWVVDFPMFEKTEGGWTFKHHPFTSPVETDPHKLIKDPGKSLSRAYDMVLNGEELGGGSIRIYNREMQKAVFSILGITNEAAEEKFGHLLTAFKYGCPPHGGIAFGLDRIVMLMTGATSLRDVIAFPKTATASCPLTNAPSAVAPEQLKELGIQIAKKP